jgi:hypothetical protein
MSTATHIERELAIKRVLNFPGVYYTQRHGSKYNACEKPRVLGTECT